MKHIRRVSVAKAQVVNINASNILNIIAWVGGMVWFYQEWKR